MKPPARTGASAGAPAGASRGASAEAAIVGALQRAGALFRARRYQEAAQAYGEVVRLRPKLPDAHHNQGVALKAAGNLTDSIACFRRAVRLKPDYLAAHVESRRSAGGERRPAGRTRASHRRLAA
ncbi:MAG: tetratricopeptide repeat protein [Thalassobaculum sp.]